MRTIIYVCTLLFGVFTYSQTIVSGTVIDQNDQPVLGANVIVVGKAVGTVTDFDGKFSFSVDQTPPFQITISNIGYTSVTRDITSNNQNLTVQLAEEATALDEIVISASRTPERIFESPVTVERFGLKEIQNTSAPSFYDGLENLKGVDINTNSLTFKSINTRGFATFANNRFMQLVDGMDNSSPALNFVLGNLLGMTELDVQSVELLPGASSALYGANAFNGILFMRSKSPFDFQGISTYAKSGFTSQEAAGDNAFYDFGIRAAHKFSDKFAAKVNFSYLRGTDWAANNTGGKPGGGATRDAIDYDGYNIYGDEVSTNIRAASDGLGVVPNVVVSRTGYAESDLTNYKAESIKFDASLHYRPFADDFEIIYQGKVGKGNTIYQGTNRYNIADFFLQQHKLEVKNDNFFVRAYTTAEKAGNSYDMVFTGININRLWKSDTDWFGDYINTYVGATFAGATEADAHIAARAAADTGRLIPGTPAFEAALNTVTNDPDLATGSKFQDNTKLYHADANYNLSYITKDFADIQVGGSWRQYQLNSFGTIFTDADGPISYSEFGAYTQIQKKFSDDRLKVTASARYDKSELFDGFVSPRLSLSYTAGENRNHNIRASYQTGFRNPTTQDLYIGLNAGRAILVGSAADNLDRYSITLPVTAEGTGLTGQTEATLTGRDAYERAFSRSSVAAGTPTAVNTPLIKPEQIAAFELGYRGQIDKFTIDLSGYYNNYTDFIASTVVLVPLYGDPGSTDVTQANLALAALGNDDFQPFQTYTNSAADIQSYGATVGVDTKVLGDFDLGVNYTYAKLQFDETSDPDFRPQFNTPEHKVKVSFGNTDLFKNFGFGINWRWSDTYFWEAAFGDGDIPAYSVLDAQVNYRVPSAKLTIKGGASNLLADEYFTAIGTGFVGSQYYLGLTINP